MVVQKSSMSRMTGEKAQARSFVAMCFITYWKRLARVEAVERSQA